MISRICICCGGLISPEANESGGNPNICLACSQLADEVEPGLDFLLKLSKETKETTRERSNELQNAS